MIRISDYSSVLNVYTLILENKFDLTVNFTKLFSDNYLEQFYDFLSSKSKYCKSGWIWNGTIEKKYLNLKRLFFSHSRIFYLESSIFFVLLIIFLANIFLI